MPKPVATPDSVLAEYYARRDANTRGMRPVISQDAAYAMLEALREIVAADNVNQAAADYRTGHGDLHMLRRAANAARAAIAAAEGSK